MLFGLRKKAPPVHNVLQKVIIPLGVPFTEDLVKKLKIKFIESTELDEKSVVNGNENFNTLKSKCRHNNNTAEIDAKKLQRNLAPELDICDSSDETSSKSTLDLIIPPPINFKGFNNPFHVNYKSDIKFKVNNEKFIKRNPVMSKFTDVRIVRTIKRRLSAKDILLGPNQEVKRRKITKRRKSADVEIISEIIQPIHLPLPHFPFRTENNSNVNRSSSVLLPLQKEMSRKSQTKINNDKISSANTNDTIKINLNDTVMNSPVKNNSINLYFGAMHRIENGEKFTILAKRITFEGKEQYLLDWDGKSQNES